MPVLTKEQILGVDDRKIETVDVPEWGEGAQVCLRRIPGTERGILEKQMNEARENGEHWKKYKPAMVCAALCDEAGNPMMFSMPEFEVLCGKSSAALERLFDVANLLNRFVADTDNEKKRS